MDQTILEEAAAAGRDAGTITAGLVKDKEYRTESVDEAAWLHSQGVAWRCAPPSRKAPVKETVMDELTPGDQHLAASSGVELLDVQGSRSCSFTWGEATIPVELRLRAQWVVWRYGAERPNGKRPKEPYSPAVGARPARTLPGRGRPMPRQ